MAAMPQATVDFVHFPSLQVHKRRSGRRGALPRICMRIDHLGAQLIEVGLDRVETEMRDNRSPERSRLRHKKPARLRTPTIGALARDGGQMIHAPMSLGKNLVQSAFARCGYRIAKADPGARYRPTPADARNAANLLREILPVVQHNALTGEWPTPAFLEHYFDASRLAMVRLLLDRCDAEAVDFAGKRVLDIGCHAGCLLHLMRARYPESALFGCDVSDVKLAMAKRACPDAELFFSALSDLPESSSYDVVFLMEVLEHMVDPETVVRRLLDIVSATGTLILTVPDGREDHLPAKEYHSEFDSYAGHINFWSPESWRYFLARIAPERTLRTGQLPTGHLFAALSM